MAADFKFPVYRTATASLATDALIKDGSVSAARAKAKADAGYDRFNRTRQIRSDFEQTVPNLYGRYRSMTEGDYTPDA